MKNRKSALFLATIMVFALALGGCGSAPARLDISGPDYTVVVVNGLDTNIQMLYVSHASRGDWGRDVLGISTIKPGASFRYSVHEAGAWDIRARDKNGKTYSLFNVNVDGEVRLTVDRSIADR